MYVSLNIGKTGLKAIQNQMDFVAEKISNVNTIGYKEKGLSFQELLNNQIFDNEVIMSNNVNNPVINQGSRSGVGKVNFTQGGLVESHSGFHLAIEGSGFFGVRDENGQLLLTRNGGFHKDENKNIIDDSGYELEMEVYIPKEEWPNENVSISKDGLITSSVYGETITLGRIVLYNPNVLDSLTPLGEGRYLPSDDVELFNSIENPEVFGNLIQNMLEASNVDLAESLSQMIIAHKGYTLNARAVQTTDEILTMINGIKR